MTRFRTYLAGALVLAVTLLTGTPASAQNHRSAFGLMGGGSVHGDLSPGLSTESVFEPGWITGLQLERWLGGGRVGLRVNTLWTQRQMDQPGASAYNVFLGETGLLLRFRRARADVGFAPFLGLSAGATHYAGIASTQTLAGGAYGDPVIRAHVTPSLGADLFASRRTGIRFEVGDQIVLPSVGYSPPAEGLPMVHNLVATLGLQVRTGWLGDQAPPAAEPAPEEPGKRDADATAGATAAAEQLAEKDRRIARLEARIDSLEAELRAARAAEQPAEASAAAVEPSADSAAGADAAPSGFTVQVGSFVERATADRWVQRLRERGFPVWRSDTQIQGESVSRVRVGLLATESEAHTLADTLRRDYGWPVWVDAIGPNENVPAGAMDRTREVLYR